MDSTLSRTCEGEPSPNALHIRPQDTWLQRYHWDQWSNGLRTIRNRCKDVCIRIYRFLARLSGRRRRRRLVAGWPSSSGRRMYQPLALVLVASAIFRIAEGCSSRSTPKPRPPSATLRPNVTFQTYACPPTYAAWYCLNGATCFTVKIGESILYNCECADGYMGQRCEFKGLDGTYLPSRERVMLETASIASGATIAVLLVVVLSIAVYIYCRRKRKESCYDSENTLKRPFNSPRIQPQFEMRQDPGTIAPPRRPDIQPSLTTAHELPDSSQPLAHLSSTPTAEVPPSTPDESHCRPPYRAHT